MIKPLDGLKVIELGTYIAIPKATRIMADWGAEVIKVEPPQGDAWRMMGRSWRVPYDEDNNPLFHSENANKKSLVLDLKDNDCKEIMFKLLETADVFATNTRLGPLKKLGFDYDSLKERFPGLIFAQFTGYGELGPDKDMPGFDSAAFWAKSGILIEWSRKNATPVQPHPGFGDGACSSAILAGILGALLNRAKTGKGELVQSSLYGCALWYNSSGVVMGQPKYNLNFPKEMKDLSNALTALYQTKDGDWFITATSTWDKHAKGIYKMLRLDEYINDPAYTVLEETRKHLPEVIETFQRGFSQVTTEEVIAGFNKIGIVYAKLVHPNDVSTDKQAWANDYLKDIAMENGDKVALPATPIKFQSMGEFEFNLGPKLGANSREIISSLGYSDERIETLIGKGVVIAK